MTSDPFEECRPGEPSGEEGSRKSGPVIKKVTFQQLPEEGVPLPRRGIAPEFQAVSLTVSAELGRIMMRVRELINLEENSVLKLNRVADEKVLILVNETPFAHGEIVVINDRFGVRVTSLVSEDDGDGAEPGSGKEV